MLRNCLALVFVLGLAMTAFAHEESRSAPTWQDAMAKGIVPYRQLTVDDFPIDDRAHPEDSFYIRAAIAPQYHFILKPYNGFIFAAIDQWLVFSGLNKNETSRKSRFKTMKAALPYAQAILDLNEIHARQMAALQPGELPQARGDTADEARTQLTSKLKEFLATKYKQNEGEIEAFAKATGRGADKKKVLELAAEIRKRLDATPATTVPYPETTAAAGSSPEAVLNPSASPAVSASPMPSPAK